MDVDSMLPGVRAVAVLRAGKPDMFEAILDRRLSRTDQLHAIAFELWANEVDFRPMRVVTYAGKAYLICALGTHPESIFVELQQRGDQYVGLLDLSPMARMVAPVVIACSIEHWGASMPEFIRSEGFPSWYRELDDNVKEYIDREFADAHTYAEAQVKTPTRRRTFED